MTTTGIMQRLQTLLKKAYIAFQKSVYAGTAAAGCFLVYHGYLLSQLKQILPDNEQAKIEITVGEEKPKLSFEDYCRLNQSVPVGTTAKQPIFVSGQRTYRGYGTGAG
ncbi:MAG: hypothetical protein ACLU99_04505 [Alphaproteobacteria bacterium]